MKTGMKAPDGMGMVVATADIQNCKTVEVRHSSDQATRQVNVRNKLSTAAWWRSANRVRVTYEDTDRVTAENQETFILCNSAGYKKKKKDRLYVSLWGNDTN